MPKYSVIIPVYNSEDYIEKCLTSFLSQKFSDYELIVVNDGSTDKSLEIIKKIHQSTSNIILINKKNEGVSQARNDALAVAKGKYILFCDSDDYVSENYFEEIDKIADKADLVIFNRVEVGKRPNPLMCKLSGYISQKDFYEVVDYLHGIRGVLWNKVFKLRFLKINEIYFPKNINWAEDQLFIIEYLKNIRTYYVSDKVLYNYLIRDNSLCHKEIKFDQYYVWINALVNLFYNKESQNIEYWKEEPVRAYLQLINRFENMKKADILSLKKIHRKIRKIYFSMNDKTHLHKTMGFKSCLLLVLPFSFFYKLKRKNNETAISQT